MLHALARIVPRVQRSAELEGIEIGAVLSRIRRVSPDKRLDQWEWCELARTHLRLAADVVSDAELETLHSAVGSTRSDGRALIDALSAFLQLRPSTTLVAHLHSHTGVAALDGGIVVRDADAPYNLAHEIALNVATRLRHDLKRRALVPSELFHWIDHPADTNCVSLRRVRTGIAKVCGTELTVDEVAMLFALLGVGRSGRLCFVQFAKLFEPEFLSRSHLLFDAAGGIAAAFERASETGEDTRMTMSDVRVIARKLVAASYGPEGADMERLFRFADTNRSGSIDYHEFRAALHVTRMEISDLAIATLFCLIDVDSSGELSLEEVGAFLEVHGCDVWESRNCPYGVRHDKRIKNDGSSNSSSRSPPKLNGTLLVANEELAAASMRDAAAATVVAGRISLPGPLLRGGTDAVAVGMQRNDALLVARIVRLHITRCAMSAAEAFGALDKDRSGELSSAELMTGLERFGLDLTRQQSNLFFDLLDVDKDGRIGFREFKSVFKPKKLENTHLFTPKNRPLNVVEAELKRLAPAPVAPEVLATIARKIRAASYTSRGSDVRRLFAYIDTDHSGDIDFNELRIALRRARVRHDAISDVEIARLYRMIDEDGSGTIEVEELVDWVNRTAPLVGSVTNAVGQTIAPPPGLLSPARDPRASAPNTVTRQRAAARRAAARKARRASPQQRARELTPQQAARHTPEQAFRTLGRTGAFAALSPDAAVSLSAAALAAIGAAVAGEETSRTVSLFRDDEKGPSAPSSPGRSPGWGWSRSRSAPPTEAAGAGAGAATTATTTTSTSSPRTTLLRRPWGSSPFSPTKRLAEPVERETLVPKGGGTVGWFIGRKAMVTLTS